MVYLTIKGKNIVKYNEILKEEDGCVYFEPRVKRYRGETITSSGFVEFTDEDMEKIERAYATMRDNSYYIKIEEFEIFRWDKRDRLTLELMEQLNVRQYMIRYTYGSRYIGTYNIKSIVKFEFKPIVFKGEEIGQMCGMQQLCNPEKISLVKTRLDGKTSFFTQISFENYKIYKLKDCFIEDGKFLSDNGVYDAEYAYLYIDNPRTYYTRTDLDIDIKAWDLCSASGIVIPDKIIKTIEHLDDRIYELLSITENIKKYNYVTMHGNKDIEYIPDNRLDRFNGDYYNEELRKKYAQRTSVMKYLRAITKLPDATITKISERMDYDIDDFGTISIISGKDITKAYLNGDTSGTIGKSCMRGEQNSHRFKIYEENAQMVAIIKDNTTYARALLWDIVDIETGEKKKFMDRIYSSDTRDVGKMCAYAKSQGWLHLEKQAYGQTVCVCPDGKVISLEKFYVQIKDMDYGTTPWVDTWYKKLGNRLYNEIKIKNLR